MDPVAEILQVAGELFGEHGVAGTSMTRIAQAAGLRQSSLYYYFSSKEELLAALVDQAGVVPLELLRRVMADGGSPATQLYRFVRGDVTALTRLPLDINEVHRLARHDPDRFPGYWRDREALVRLLAGTIRTGVDEGELREVDARRAALTVLATDEGSQNWYRGRTRPSLDVVACEVADVAVAGLLAPGASLEAIRDKALPFE
jgi:AcrR family transcriptional regulator